MFAQLSQLRLYLIEDAVEWTLRSYRVRDLAELACPCK